MQKPTEIAAAILVQTLVNHSSTAAGGDPMASPEPKSLAKVLVPYDELRSPPFTLRILPSAEVLGKAGLPRPALTILLRKVPWARCYRARDQTIARAAVGSPLRVSEAVPAVSLLEAPDFSKLRVTKQRNVTRDVGEQLAA